VGNIPYDATEEQLTEVFSEAGRVLSFRLVFDRESGKPKGYGFCEYADAQTALSAMRNLNGWEMNGRPLRVDFAESEGSGGLSWAAGTGSTTSTTSTNQPAPTPVQNLNLKGDIAKVLEGMSTSQLYEIMVQMKGLMTKNPEQAKQLLLSNPPFTYALLQASVLLGLITSQTAQQMQIMQPVINPMSHVVHNPMVSMMGMNTQMGAPFGGFAPNQPNMNPFQGGNVNPGFPGMNMGGINQPNMGAEQLEDVLPDDQKELLATVLKLTPEQIEKLPPHEQAPILQLRQTMLSLNYRR